ncbi:MAG TPA: acyl-CoA dehydrogenase family protein [Candidatus Thermoplasmatota archaeon]|nr:acyl-CoA dehydrogenase family protein [Candidatus Thermoplasmatota archaeon]
MDFTIPADLEAIRARVEAFVRDVVIPVETDAEHDPKTLEELRQKARAAGLWTPHLPRDWGGLGLGTMGMALVSKELGASRVAPLAVNASAPDEGNMHLLLAIGTHEQQQRWLRPLADGAIRSCFAMTEKDAGSDPTRIQTRAIEKDGAWEITGDKWFITGAEGAAFAIVVAMSDPNVAQPHERYSLFLVDAKDPGWRVLRQVPVLGTHAPGGHCEVALRGARAQLLGQRGKGFAHAQHRLAGGRIAHAMRWLGVAQRSLDLAAQRALSRETFGERLAERQAVQWMLAESAMDLHASRLMVLHAAWKIDRGLEHRQEIAMVKVFVANALHRVVDRAIQVHGALGYSDDLPLARFYADARAARIYDGPDEVHMMQIAKTVLREAAKRGTTRGAV